VAERESDVQAGKARLRDRVSAQLASVAPQQKAQESERICWILEGLLHPPRAEVIAVYFPLSDEPDITPLIEAMLRAGQPLCAPRVDGRNLVMHRFTSLQGLKKGRYGNLEPSSDSKPQPEPQFVLLPCVAFDRSGNRLGRGLGFYDCFIENLREENPKAELLGVCFSCQLLENIPTLPHDQKVTRVVSADEIVNA